MWHCFEVVGTIHGLDSTWVFWVPVFGTAIYIKVEMLYKLNMKKFDKSTYAKQLLCDLSFKFIAFPEE